jgi:hypothetical protein
MTSLRELDKNQVNEPDGTTETTAKRWTTASCIQNQTIK